MADGSPHPSVSSGGQGRSRFIVIVLCLLAGILITFGVETVVSPPRAEDWDDVAARIANAQLATAAEAFETIQKSVEWRAQWIASSRGLAAALAMGDSGAGRIFSDLEKVDRGEESSVEVYRDNRNPVAWDGPRLSAGTSLVATALKGEKASALVSDPISIRLIVAVPVRDSGKVVGAVAFGRAVEVNYPLTNAFIRGEGFAERLSREEGFKVRLQVGSDSLPSSAGQRARVIRSIGGAAIGTIVVGLPSREQVEQEARLPFVRFRMVLVFILLFVLAVGAGRTILRAPGALLRALTLTALLWGLRYLLLWLDLPASLIRLDVFDPSFFASTYGGGIARSLGELAVTAVALATNVWLLARYGIRHDRLVPSGLSRLPAAPRLLLALAVSGLTMWLLRGYAALIRGAVFDSTFSFNNPRLVAPTVEYGIMMAVLSTASICFVAATVWSTLVIVGLSRVTSARRAGWIIGAVIFLLAATGFEIVSPHPLVPIEYRILFVIGALLFAWYVRSARREGVTAFSRSRLLLGFALSAVALYPLLDRFSHEKDHQRVELLAHEIARPVDSWLTFVLVEALQQLSSADAMITLDRGDSAEIRQLAFARWAQSAACREGFAAAFAILDSSGAEVSRFTIGGQSAALWSVESDLSLTDTIVTQVHDLWQGERSTKVYAGSIPLKREDGTRVGYGVATIAAGSESLFRGENPPVLRSASFTDMESFHAPLVLAEFRSGRIATTTEQIFPVGFRLPAKVREALLNPLTASIWFDTEVNDDRFEGFYFRRDSGAEEVFAILMPWPGLLQPVVGLAGVIVSYLVMLLGIFTVYTGAALVRGRSVTLSFRDRLLGALLVTAIVPLVLILVYGRYYTRERLTEYTTRRLEDETAAVLAGIEGRTGALGSFDLRARLAELNAQDLATELGLDFAVHVGRDLIATSRPELYDAGILDSRLSGTAYARVELEGRQFHLETERIGRYQYAVGFRPIFDERGKVAAILSVPTLFRQEEIERDAARQYAFLFGVASLILLSMVVIATVAANRIAAPLQQLTDATRRISGGDLEVTVEGVHSANDEIGELTRSFNAMTRELKRSREELVRAERDIAWREMAKQVAHEIKNPLTPIKLAIQHLQHAYRDRKDGFEEVLEDVAATVTGQIETLSRIASEFSHFGRMPRRQSAPCDVNMLVGDVVRLFSSEAGMQFDVRLASDLPAVNADGEELRRAFVNIVRNGVQAMEGRGTMEVRTALHPAGVSISFRDFGPGIPEDLRDRLFEPKVSTKPDGMGLGLVIVKKTVDDLGGSITVGNAPGTGAVVTVILPAGSGGAREAENPT